MRRWLTLLLFGAAPAAALGEGHLQLFISPMGEPFRAAHGPERRWFDGADSDHDGRITRTEFEADAARFFTTLDSNGDGEIDPDEIDHYETVVAPEIRVRDAQRGADGATPLRGGGRGRSGGGQGRGGMGTPSMHFGNGGSSTPTPRAREGAARFGYLDLPEPVVAADRNGNRGIDHAEFVYAADQRFAALDRNGDGAITRGELPRLSTAR